MVNKSSQDPDQIRDACFSFVDGCQSVVIASLDSDRLPEASYAPFVRHGGDFYVFVSELASHTRNLLATPSASLLFIEDEEQASNVFARRRTQLQCEAAEVSRSMPEYDQLLDRFEVRFGKLFKMMRTLPDFHLIRLIPRSGNYVVGFGKAFRLSGENLRQVEQRGPANG